MNRLNILISALILISSGNNLRVTSHSENSRSGIDSLYDVNINGVTQKILVQSRDLSNPVLLYLHGGPGSSLMMLSHVYSDKLKEKFIFVNWDQRGTALSYHEDLDSTKISEEQILNDALDLTKYLIKTFHKQKIFVLGHSFGSIIGLRLVTEYPEYYYAYVGAGQVIDWNRSVSITYDWLHDQVIKAKDTTALRRIESGKFPFTDLIVKYGGYSHVALNRDSIKKTSPYYFEGYADLAEKARKFSEYWVEKNLNRNSIVLYRISEIKVPIYFFEGKYDHVMACAPVLVVDFCRKVKAPKKEIIWFNNSGHLMNLEEPVKFQDELIHTVLKHCCEPHGVSPQDGKNK